METSVTVLLETVSDEGVREAVFTADDEVFELSVVNGSVFKAVLLEADLLPPPVDTARDILFPLGS